MNNNSVELIGIYGDDEIIACSAWTSTSRELTKEKKNRIPELINDLWNNGHETPFEKGVVHFLVNCDIASHIHLLKHRMSSLNAESARYKELKEDKFYLPKDWIGIDVNEKHYNFNYLNNQAQANDYEYLWRKALYEFSSIANELYHKCLEDLTPILGRKRAKESARYFKTYNSQIQSDIMFNMRSFANFLKLRKSEHAQLEINEIASRMLELVRQTGKFEHTLNAWGYDRIIDNGDME
jgi:flavin-dependent thymidylate synthase